MATVTIYGASDDLVEIEGDLNEEFNPHYDGEGMALAFGDGSIIDVRYESGVWRISQRHAGSATVEKVEAPPDDEDNYSDRVTLTGDLRWVFAAEKPTLHKIQAAVSDPEIQEAGRDREHLSSAQAAASSDPEIQEALTREEKVGLRCGVSALRDEYPDASRLPDAERALRKLGATQEQTEAAASK